MTFLRFRIVVALLIVVAGYVSASRGSWELASLLAGVAIFFGVASSNPTKKDALALICGVAAIGAVIGFAAIQFWEAAAMAGLSLLISYFRIRTVNRTMRNSKLADLG